MVAAIYDATPELPRPIRLARLTSVRLSLTAPIDIHQVVGNAGLVLHEMEISGPVDGFLAHHRRTGRFGIIVNSRFRDPLRRRFTIAHELGHYVLHRHVVLAAGSRQVLETPALEWEASQYAAELLMPERFARQFVQMGIHNLDYEVRRNFGVSMSAWYRRLSDLGIHIHPAYR